MSLIWAALIFALGLFVGALLAFLLVMLDAAARIADDTETIYRGGESR